jgi:hypothetical protein
MKEAFVQENMWHTIALNVVDQHVYRSQQVDPSRNRYYQELERRANLPSNIKWTTIKNAFGARIQEAILTDSIEEMKDNCNKEAHPMKYSFNSLHPSDIDFHAIGEDLSKAHPIALVYATDSECYIVIHNSILKKCEAIGANIFNGLEEDVILFSSNFCVISLTSPKFFGYWKDRIEKIKKATWGIMRRDATVTVSIP